MEKHDLRLSGKKGKKLIQFYTYKILIINSSNIIRVATRFVKTTQVWNPWSTISAEQLYISVFYIKVDGTLITRLIFKFFLTESSNAIWKVDRAENYCFFKSNN